MGTRARRPQEGQGRPPPNPQWGRRVALSSPVPGAPSGDPGGGHVLVTSLIAFPEVRDPPPAHSHGPRSLHATPPQSSPDLSVLP